MHSQEKMRTLRHCFVLFILYNMTRKKKKGQNGIMTKRCGFSFNSYKMILVNQITFCGKIIQYGLGITYIYVRTPDSNKMYFWNYTPLL